MFSAVSLRWHLLAQSLMQERKLLMRCKQGRKQRSCSRLLSPPPWRGGFVVVVVPADTVVVVIDEVVVEVEVDSLVVVVTDGHCLVQS
jgi:hypothetical protein